MRLIEVKDRLLNASMIESVEYWEYVGYYDVHIRMRSGHLHFLYKLTKEELESLIVKIQVHERL